MNASRTRAKGHIESTDGSDPWSLDAMRDAHGEDQILSLLLFGNSRFVVSGATLFGVHSAEIIRLGLPAAALLRVKVSFSLSESSLAAVLGLTPATIRRREKAGMLKPPEADRLARMARVLAHALRVFEDPARVSSWLKGRVPALEDRTPLELLDTDAGATEVDAVLTRLEHGVIG